jgi:hypothetical protein
MNYRKICYKLAIELLYLLGIVLVIAIVSMIFLPDEHSKLATQLENIMLDFDKNDNKHKYNCLLNKNNLRIEDQLLGKWRKKGRFGFYHNQLLGKWRTRGRFGFYNEIYISPDRTDKTMYHILFTTSTCTSRYTTSRHAVLDEQTGTIYLNKSLVCVGHKQAFNSFKLQRKYQSMPNALVPDGYIKNHATTFLQEYMAVYPNTDTKN